MRVARIGMGLALALFCACVESSSQEQKMIVTGILTRVMAIGGESTGWAIQLDSEANIDGKQVNTIEIASHESRRLEKLQNKRVRAIGNVSHRNGVETGSRSLLDVSSIEETAKTPVREQGTAPSVPDRDLTQLFSHIWQVTGAPSKPAPGSIYIFLANGTLLQTSCAETYRIARWSIDKGNSSVLRVMEDGQLAFTAVITSLADVTLQLQQKLVRGNETRGITLKAVEQEFVCPDLPK